MPFLRAARIKKNLQPEIERVKVLPTLVVEEQTEPEEEFTPTQIEDLHRLIDIRTKEAEQKEPEILQPENVIVVVPEFVPEAETIILDAESVQEIPEAEDESVTPESELSQPDESQEVTPKIIAPEATTESIAPESEHEHETVTPEAEIEPEISQPESESAQESSQPELSQEVTDETVTQEAEIETEDSQTESESSQEELTENETITPESEAQEPEISQPQTESEAGILPEDSNTASTDFDENSILDEPSQNETPNLEAETVTETPELEPGIITPENESESSQEDLPQEPKSQKDYSGSQLNYDFTSGERYVDKVSTKTEFDKMLDELANISKELLSWQADKFAHDYTGKFQEGESSQAEARKYEAFLGGYITNAAMMLYDKGYREAAIKQLEQAKSILDARKKLEDETSAIKSRVEEQNDSVDLSDILGLFGDG